MWQQIYRLLLYLLPRYILSHTSQPLTSISNARDTTPWTRMTRGMDAWCDNVHHPLGPSLPYQRERQREQRYTDGVGAADVDGVDA